MQWFGSYGGINDKILSLKFALEFCSIHRSVAKFNYVFSFLVESDLKSFTNFQRKTLELIWQIEKLVCHFRVDAN